MTFLTFGSLLLPSCSPILAFSSLILPLCRFLLLRYYSFNIPKASVNDRLLLRYSDLNQKEPYIAPLASYYLLFLSFFLSSLIHSPLSTVSHLYTKPSVPTNSASANLLKARVNVIFEVDLCQSSILPLMGV